MARLTITLTDGLHRALKESAARKGTTIGALVAESLEHYGVKTSDDARQLVERARDRSRLSAEEALRVAVEQTRTERRS